VLLNVKGFTKEKFLQLKLYAEDGNYTWKFLGFIAGLLLMGISFLNFFSHLLFPAYAVLDVYIFVFGAIACVLEFKDKVFTKSYLVLIRKEAAFLYKPYGRALFYIFVGVLEIAKGGILSLIVGLYVTVVGFIIYQSSLVAIKQLNELKDAKYNEKTIASKFQEFDADNSGTLDTKEVAALCQSLGSVLTLNELESAIALLDTNNDGRIQYSEFFDWWKGKDDFLV
jgi:hypothetical protein